MKTKPYLAIYYNKLIDGKATPCVELIQAVDENIEKYHPLHVFLRNLTTVYNKLSCKEQLLLATDSGSKGKPLSRYYPQCFQHVELQKEMSKIISDNVEHGLGSQNGEIDYNIDERKEERHQYKIEEDQVAFDAKDEDWGKEAQERYKLSGAKLCPVCTRLTGIENAEWFCRFPKGSCRYPPCDGTLAGPFSCRNRVVERLQEEGRTDPRRTWQSDEIKLSWEIILARIVEEDRVQTRRRREERGFTRAVSEESVQMKDIPWYRGDAEGDAAQDSGTDIEEIPIQMKDIPQYKEDAEEDLSQDSGTDDEGSNEGPIEGPTDTSHIRVIV